MSAPILVVDDDPDTLELLCQVLRRDGFECLAADDGATALELFRSTEVGAALIDFELPDLTGVQLIRQFKMERPEVPVLLMTGNPSQRVIFEACDAGAYTYLRKPLNLMRVRELLRRAQRSREDYQLTMTHMEIKRTSVLVRWGRWIVRKK